VIRVWFKEPELIDIEPVIHDMAFRFGSLAKTQPELLCTISSAAEVELGLGKFVLKPFMSNLDVVRVPGERVGNPRQSLDDESGMGGVGREVSMHMFDPQSFHSERHRCGNWGQHEGPKEEVWGRLVLPNAPFPGGEISRRVTPEPSELRLDDLWRQEFEVVSSRIERFRLVVNRAFLMMHQGEEFDRYAHLFEGVHLT
jgi:hypothetical protein